MKIRAGNIRQILQEGRIFVARGTTDIKFTGAGILPDQLLNVQEEIRLEPYTTFWGQTAKSLVTMGSFSYTHSLLSEHVRVGRYTSIAKGLQIMGDSHPVNWGSTSPVFYNHRAMVRTFLKDHETTIPVSHYRPKRENILIGNDVWIGENVTLAAGIRIGNGAVIASHAVVTKDVESYTVVGGVPARKIRNRFDQDCIDLMLESKWWEYRPDLVAPFRVEDPVGFAVGVIENLRSTNIPIYKPKPLLPDDFSQFACH